MLSSAPPLPPSWSRILVCVLHVLLCQFTCLRLGSTLRCLPFSLRSPKSVAGPTSFVARVEYWRERHTQSLRKLRCQERTFLLARVGLLRHQPRPHVPASSLLPRLVSSRTRSSVCTTPTWASRAFLAIFWVQLLTINITPTLLPPVVVFLLQGERPSSCSHSLDRLLQRYQGGIRLSLFKHSVARRLRSCRPNFLAPRELPCPLLHPVSVGVRLIYVMIWLLSLDTSPYIHVNRTPPFAIVVLDQPTIACAPLWRELLEMPPSKCRSCFRRCLVNPSGPFPCCPIFANIEFACDAARHRLPISSSFHSGHPSAVCSDLGSGDVQSSHRWISCKYVPTSPCTPHLAFLPGMRSPPTPGMGAARDFRLLNTSSARQLCSCGGPLTVLALATPFVCHQLITLHPQTEPSAVVNLRIHLWSALACLLGRQCIGPASLCASGLANMTSHVSCDRSCRTTRRSVQVVGRSQSFLSLVCIQAHPVSSSSSLALSELTLSLPCDSPTGLFTAGDSSGRMALTCLCTSATAAS